MSSVALRHFREEDFQSVMELERASFPVDAYTPAMLRNRITTYPNGFWVARQNELLVGYIAAWIVDGRARIDSMAVAADHRNYGIGTRLLLKAIEHFAGEGHTTIELELRPSNTTARRLYRKFGFKDAGKKPGYYKDGADALVMRRSLKE